MTAEIGTHAQSVETISVDRTYAIEAQQTQTEVKPGWKIADIQLKSRMQRYLWGTRAKQLVDGNRPQFIVNTDSLLLSDMVLIKLKTKKSYRKIPKAVLRDNDCIFVNLNNFSIQAHGDESFIIQPLSPLDAGEYFFTWLTGEPIGDLGDWRVWPFSIR
ncbi:MAG: hypothetical protein K2J00_05675 [Bacteroidaceae bacterium]|nr:hypothetical protein [Bacteroidaceae bacterium]